jgi:hypothetical protein
MSNRVKLIIVILALAGAILACSFPSVQTKPTQEKLSPDQVMTAVFSSGILGSLTPPAANTGLAVTETSNGIPTNTLLPTLAVAVSQVPTSTQTPIPSLTPTVSPPPTLTPKAILPGRPGAHIAAAYFKDPPILDGNWDDWVTPEYSANGVVYGSGNWTGAADLSSAFRVGWDIKNLYIAAKVRDDIYAQNASGNNLYLGDSLEILLDTDLKVDYYNNVLSPDDYQLGISPGFGSIQGAKEAYLWFPRYLMGTRGAVQIESIPMADGYRVEAAIPWSVFGITPIAGYRYGFAFSVSDNDLPNQNAQQTMISSASKRVLTQPMSWGELFLNPK